MTNTTTAVTTQHLNSPTPDEIADAQLLSVLHADGYVDVKRMPDGTYAGLFQFMYTWAIIAEMTLWGYEERWCYASYDKAKAALDAWDGTGEPAGWHRHPDTGRRRNDDGSEAGVW